MRGIMTLLVLSAAFCQTYAADIDAGKMKAEVLCQTCHGMDGIATNATVPNISGQQNDYTKIQLEAYRSGERKHAQMTIVSQSLSDEDIENLAAWYGAIKVTIEMPE